MPSSGLTKGCVTKMFGGVAQLYAGQIPPQPIVQVESIETFQVYKEGILIPDPDRYKIAISDGDFTLEGLVLTKNNNHLIDSNKVQVGSLICLEKFAFYEHYFIWEGPTYKNYVHVQVDDISVVKKKFWRVGKPKILAIENTPKIRSTQTTHDFDEAIRYSYHGIQTLNQGMVNSQSIRHDCLACVFRFIMWFTASFLMVILYDLVEPPASFLLTVVIFLGISVWNLMILIIERLYVIPLTLWQDWGSKVACVQAKDRPIFGTDCNQYPVYVQNGEVIFTGSDIGLEFPMNFNKIYVITKHEDPKNLEDYKNQFKCEVPASQAKIFDGNGNKINVILNLAGILYCHNDANDESSMDNCNVDFKYEGQTVVYEIRLCTKHRKFVTHQGIVLPTKTELVAKNPHTRQMTAAEFQKILTKMDKEIYEYIRAEGRKKNARTEIKDGRVLKDSPRHGPNTVHQRPLAIEGPKPVPANPSKKIGEENRPISRKEKKRQRKKINTAREISEWDDVE